MQARLYDCLTLLPSVGNRSAKSLSWSAISVYRREDPGVLSCGVPNSIARVPQRVSTSLELKTVTSLIRGPYKAISSSRLACKMVSTYDRGSNSDFARTSEFSHLSTSVCGIRDKSQLESRIFTAPFPPLLEILSSRMGAHPLQVPRGTQHGKLQTCTSPLSPRTNSSVTPRLSCS